MAKQAEVPTLDEVVNTLVKQAKGKGMVTYDQLNALLPDAANDPEQLDTILEQLEGRGVELIEEFSEEEAPGPGQEEAEEVVDTSDTEIPNPDDVPDENQDEESAPSVFEVQNPLASADETVERIDDPVRMYLSQMGEIPLLTRDQEIELARRIEIYREGFRRKVVTMPDAIKRGIQWVEEQKEIKELQEKNAKSHGSSPSRDEYLEQAESHLASLYRLVEHIQPMVDKLIDDPGECGRPR